MGSSAWTDGYDSDGAWAKKSEPPSTSKAPVRNPFPEMMAHPSRAAQADDPWVTGCLYCVQLLYIDTSDPLYGIKYYGQTLGVGGADGVVEKRWKQEVRQASREHKQIGFIAALDTYGEDAFEWTLVMSLEGRRTQMQELVDIGEKGLIAEAGGPLRDMDKRLHQTLNQTKGGSGNARWASIDAFRKKAFIRFKTEMEAYVDEHDSSLVPFAYVNPLTGYKLGTQLNSFRQGRMRYGSPDREVNEDWAEALPKWAWDATKTEEYHEANAERRREWWSNQTEDAKISLIAKQKATVNKPENLAAKSKRTREFLANETDEAKEVRLNKMKDAHNTPEYIAAAAKRGREQAANETEDAKAKRLAKSKATKNTPENLAADAKRGREQAANETEKAKARRLAKMTATKNAKTDANLVGLTGKAFELRKKAIAKSRRSDAKRVANLKLYQAVKPGATRADMRLAKRNGWKPVAPETTVE